MTIIPSEPIGSIPRPALLIKAISGDTFASGNTALAKTRARVQGTALTEKEIEGR